MAGFRGNTKEQKFADLIWEAAPIASNALVALAKERLGWAKSTTYTVLRRLTDKGLFVNDRGIVRVLIPRAEFEASRSREFVDTCFNGSLPSFLNAFTDGSKLTDAEIDALERLIEEQRRRRQ